MPKQRMLACAGELVPLIREIAQTAQVSDDFNHESVWLRSRCSVFINRETNGKRPYNETLTMSCNLANTRFESRMVFSSHVAPGMRMQVVSTMSLMR